MTLSLIEEMEEKLGGMNKAIKRYEEKGEWARVLELEEKRDDLIKAVQAEKLKEESGSNDVATMKDTLGNFWYVADIDSMYHVTSKLKNTTTAFNRRYSSVVSSPYEYVKDELGQGADSIMFNPSEGFPSYMENGLRYVNTVDRETWTKPYEDKSEWENLEGIKTIQDHFLNNIEEGGEELLKWIAWVVQNPGKKLSWAPLVFGLQGTFKSGIRQLINCKFNDPDLVRSIKPQDIMKEKNAFLDGAICVVLEEVSSGVRDGSTDGKLANELKDMITSDTLSVRPLYQETKVIKNRVNFIGFSNFENAMHIEASDRRWFVVRYKWDTTREMLNDIPDPEAYYGPVWDLIEENPRAIVSWLESIDTSSIQMHKVPMNTKAKSKMATNSETKLAEILFELVENPEIKGVGGRLISYVHLEPELEKRLRYVPRLASVETELKRMGYSLQKGADGKPKRVEVDCVVDGLLDKRYTKYFLQNGMGLVGKPGKKPNLSDTIERDYEEGRVVEMDEIPW